MKATELVALLDAAADEDGNVDIPGIGRRVESVEGNAYYDTEATRDTSSYAFVRRRGETAVFIVRGFHSDRIKLTAKTDFLIEKDGHHET